MPYDAGFLASLAPKSLIDYGNQQADQQNQQALSQLQQAHAAAQMPLIQAQTQSAQQDLASKKRGLAISVVAPILNEPDPVKQQALYGTLSKMAGRVDPTLQLPDEFDPSTLKALVQTQVPISSMPEYQMNSAKAAFYRTLADQASGGQGQPPAGIPTGGQPASGMPGSGTPAVQGAIPPPTGASILSQPNIAQGLAIFDPAGSQALTAQQKLQYESPEGKQAGAEGEKTGQIAAEAGKTFSVAASNLPFVLSRFTEMRDAAKDASYGPDWAVNNDGTGIMQQFHNSRDDETAKANSALLQRGAQGILTELGPQLAQAGVRGNKFLESIASSASGIHMAQPPAAKANAIDGLESQYIRSLKATAQEVRSYGGKAPTDAEIDAAVAQYKANPQPNAQPGQTAMQQAKGMLKPPPGTAIDTPESIGKAYQAGKITAAMAKQLLANHGYQ